MVCDDVKRIAYFFLDETLGENKRRELISHLSRCRGCDDRISVLRRLRRFIRSRLGRLVAPATLRDRIARAVSGITTSSS